jgi:Ca2+-binding RTX toxin-like protein
VASAGDINGDGFADLIIGAYRGDAAGNAKIGAGDSYVVFGKASGWGAAIDLTTIAAGTGGFVIHGQDVSDYSGTSVASAGDINGDGFADLIIGAKNGDAAGNAKAFAGDSYVVFGKASGWGAAIDLATIAAGTGGFVIHGQDAYDQSGYSVASAGDINGDGFADLIIGANGADAAGNAKIVAGDSYVVFGKASGWGAAIDLATIAAGTGGFVIHGQDGDDFSGASVASAGDINGDGFADLIIGAGYGDAAGNAKSYAGDSYVVFGKASGWGAAIDLATIAAGTGGFVIHGQDRYDQSGRSVASAGDINGDGFADLIIGARYGDGTSTGVNDNRGDSYVVFGKASGWGAAIDLTTIAAGTGGFVIHGQDGSDRSGTSVASAGDINGDGFADLIIGAAEGNAAGNSKNGAGDSYVIFGRDFTNTVTHAGTASAEVLTGTNAANVMVAGLGNDTLDGLGGADALKGGAGDDRIQIADLAFLNIDGGTGTDTLALTGSGITLNLASIADTKLQDIEAIDLGAGGNTLRLTALEVLNLSDTTNTLRVTGATGASIQFDDTGWVQGATTGGFTSFTNGAASVIFADGSDTIVGGVGSNQTLSGGEYDDRLVAGNGLGQFLVGDVGNDTLVGGEGRNQEAYGGNGGDSLNGGSGAGQQLYGEAGNDSLLAGSGSNQWLFGGDDADRLNGGSGAGQQLYGEAGNDTLVGGGGRNQEAYGGNGGDSLNGGSGAGQQLYGEAGNDSLLAGSGSNQWLFGGDDADRLNGGSGAGQQLHGEAGNDTLLAGGGSNQWLFGGDDADRLNGGSGAGQQLYGEAGNDTLLAGGGSNQWLFGGDAADSLNGGSGAGQQLYGEAGNDTLLAGSGTRQEAYGGDGGDRLNGGSGTAQELYGEAGNDTLIAGTGNEQILFGGEGADSLVGGSGPNQSLYGEAGDDTLVAGTGSNQTLYGGGGSDSLVGSEGTSWVSYAFAGEAVTVDLAAGRSFGADGKDSLMGIEAAQGGSFADYLVSGPGGDQTLMGNAGNDTLIGGGAGDHLSGGAGDDVILTGTTTLADIYALFAT